MGTETMSTNPPDFRVANHGTLWTFTPLTPAAIAHASDHFPEDCPTLGAAYAVEHRFGADILGDLIAWGFEIA